MKIHIIITGGTIDSSFNPAKDTVEIGQKTLVLEYLRSLQLHNELESTVVFMKDSREIRYQDRTKLLQVVKKSPHKLILITHGTYTMPDTAQYLKDHLPKNNKTIVLTGSMIPLKGFDFSDASFNLGYAIANLQMLKSGVYICMNGKVFDPKKVDKNKIAGRFEEVKPS
ncbi:MAG: asparaginase domain-containing protein [Candidatus Micrarchaeota archaeon]